MDVVFPLLPNFKADSAMRICKHFPQCGGCRFQNMPYPEQLRMKESRIKNMIDSSCLCTELRPINHYREWFYRNKMEFTFSGSEKEGLICGLHRKKERRRVFDLEECLIFSPDVGRLLDGIRECLKERYFPYNAFTHRGFLRHLIIRETKFTREYMIGIVTTSKEKLDKRELLDKLSSLTLSSQLKSVYWIINDSWGDAVVPQDKNLFWGEPFVTERLGALDFRIFIDSFFQTNSLGIKDLYKKIAEYACLTGKESILDLYCGVGSIGLFLAQQAKFVWGVELKKEIIDNAVVNARLNNIKNISFICYDVKKFLGQRDISGIDIAVINPPRCGLSNTIKRRLLKIKPPVIFYSSCNPYTFFVDLKDLSFHYKIEFIEPFDFFPHTPHVECLALLRS